MESLADRLEKMDFSSKKEVISREGKADMLDGMTKSL